MIDEPSARRPRTAWSGSWALRIALIAAAVVAQVGVGVQGAQALPRTHCDIVGCNYPDNVPPVDKTIPASDNPVRQSLHGLTAAGGSFGQVQAWYDSNAECEAEPEPGGCGFPEAWGTIWSGQNYVNYTYEIDRLINPQTGETVQTLSQMTDLLWDSFYLNVDDGGDAPFQMTLNSFDNHYEDAEDLALGVGPYETVSGDQNGEAQCFSTPDSCSNRGACLYSGPNPRGMCESHQDRPGEYFTNPVVTGLAAIGPDPSEQSGWFPQSGYSQRFNVFHFCTTCV